MENSSTLVRSLRRWALYIYRTTCHLKTVDVNSPWGVEDEVFELQESGQFHIMLFWISFMGMACEIITTQKKGRTHPYTARLSRFAPDICIVSVFRKRKHSWAGLCFGEWEHTPMDRWYEGEKLEALSFVDPRPYESWLNGVLRAFFDVKVLFLYTEAGWIHEAHVVTFETAALAG